MTDQFKFIVAKNGFGYNDADIRNIMFHSDYKLLKQFVELTGSLSFDADNLEKTLSINHNLGYVPAYIPFVNRPDVYDDYIEKYSLLNIYADGALGSLSLDSYVDSTKILFKASVPDTFHVYSPFPFGYPDMYSNNGSYNLTFGKEGSDGRDGAIRFYDVNILKNTPITGATIEFWISEKGSSTSDAKLKCWGIDEDDCGEIWENLGREKTTAYTTQNVAAGASSYFGINVTEQVREIIARNGWSANNHMGFYIFNDGSPDNTFRRDYDYLTYLKITLSGSYTMYFKAVVFLDKIV